MDSTAPAALPELSARELVGQAAGLVSVQGLVTRADVPRAAVMAVIRGESIDDPLRRRVRGVAEGIVPKQGPRTQNAARKLEPPAAFAPLEAALAALDRGESSR